MSNLCTWVSLTRPPEKTQCQRYEGTGGTRLPSSQGFSSGTKVFRHWIWPSTFGHFTTNGQKKWLSTTFRYIIMTEIWSQYFLNKIDIRNKFWTKTTKYLKEKREKYLLRDSLIRGAVFFFFYFFLLSQLHNEVKTNFHIKLLHIQ